tara:strand:- start:52 stop:363 length:312 start_codon:yes stop_codon:yes gene_type:complete
MKVYNKLVRDRITFIMSAEGKKFKAHHATEEEYEEKLKEKLLEEVNEFIENPCIEELADIFEVFSAIVDMMGYPQEDLIECMNAKAEEKGAFENKIILESVEE